MQPTEILIDSIGVGAGVVDRLRELGLPVRGINVSESPSMKGVYNNLRTELWFKAKAWLEDKPARSQTTPTCWLDLTAIRYSFSQSAARCKQKSRKYEETRIAQSRPRRRCLPHDGVRRRDCNIWRL